MSRRCSLFASAAAGFLLALSGCGGGRPTKAQKNGPQAPEQAAGALYTAAGRDDPGIDIDCAAKRIRNTPAQFHWSYKKEVIGLSAADWEADIKPNAIAGTFVDNSGTHAIRGARANGTSWNTAVMTLTSSLPASTFALVSNSSAKVRAGAENMNGQATIKYTIDTSHETAADASLIRSVMGAGGFIRGIAWVTVEGCPVKFVLDSEDHHNGSAQKEHSELNVTQP